MQPKFLILIALIFFIPKSFATPSCPLRIAAPLNEAQTAQLTSQGYRVVVDPSLNFTSFKTYFGLLQSSSFALQFEQRQWRIYFSLQSDPFATANWLYTWSANFTELRDCAEVRRLAETMGGQRDQVTRALDFFRGQNTMGDAFVRSEEVYAELRGEAPNRIVTQNYRELLALLRSRLPAQGDFFDRHDELRRLLFAYGLVHYCSGQASVSEFLRTRCANCSAQSKLILSLYHDLALEPPAGWSFGAEVFSDHVRPIIFNRDRRLVLDLVYNMRSNGLPNPIMSPDGLLRKTLLGVQRASPRLFRDDDNFDGSIARAYAYLPKAVDAPTPLMDQIMPDPRGLPADPTIFDVASANAFSNEPAPATADLSWALGNRSDAPPLLLPPAEIPRPHLNFSAFGAARERLDPAQYPDFSPSAWASLLPNEEFLWRRIRRDGKFKGDDLRVLGYENIPGYRAPNDLSTRRLLTPLRIDLAPPDEDSLRHYFAYLDCVGEQIHTCVRVLRLYDPATFQKLTKASLAERYAWLYAQILREEDDYFGLHQAALKKFAADPVVEWTKHRADARLALLSLDQLVRGYSILGDSEGVNFLAGRDARLTHLWDDVGEVRRLLSAPFGGRARSILQQLSALDDSNLRDFFRWFENFDDLGQRFGPALDPLDSTEDQHEIRGAPLATLLGSMLLDPDYLFSAPMSASEREEFRDLFTNGGGPLPEDVLGIHLPVVDWGLKCAPGERALDYGSLRIECPTPPPSAAARRAPIALNPLLLPGLMAYGDLSFLRPAWAAAIFEAWRDSNNEAAKVVSQDWRRWEPPAAKAIAKDRVAPWRALDLYWAMLDGLLAPNLPAFPREKIPDHDLRDSDDRFLLRYSLYVNLNAYDMRPEWIEDRPLFAEAWDFYRRFRPVAMHTQLIGADLTGPSGQKSRRIDLPYQSQQAWFSHFSDPDANGSPNPWGTIEVEELGNRETALRMVILEGGRTFLLDMRRNEHQFYLAPPAFN